MRVLTAVALLSSGKLRHRSLLTVLPRLYCRHLQIFLLLCGCMFGPIFGPEIGGNTFFLNVGKTSAILLDVTLQNKCSSAHYVQSHEIITERRAVVDATPASSLGGHLLR